MTPRYTGQTVRVGSKIRRPGVTYTHPDQIVAEYVGFVRSQMDDQVYCTAAPDGLGVVRSFGLGAIEILEGGWDPVKP